MSRNELTLIEQYNELNVKYMESNEQLIRMEKLYFRLSVITWTLMATASFLARVYS